LHQKAVEINFTQKEFHSCSSNLWSWMEVKLAYSACIGPAVLG